MNRDGNTQSIWQDNIQEYTPVNNWDKNTVYDVLIVGGGITGLTTALLLQSQGRKCILAEAHTIGFGTTSGTTGHLNTLLDAQYNQIEKDFSQEDSQLVASSAREAIDLVEGLISKYNIDCDFSYQSGYIFSETEAETEELEKIKDAACRAGVVTAWVEHISIPTRFRKAMRAELQAQIHAARYITGLAKAFEQEGGVLLQQCAVNKIASGDHYTADTLLGQIKAGIVIYATHIPPGINLLHFRCAPYRSYAMAFTLNGGEYPEGVLYDMKDPYHYYRTYTAEDGKKYVVAGGNDHKTGHEENTEHTLRDLEAYFRNIFDIDKVVYKWSSQYYVPADGLPYIGVLPGHTNVYTATGFNGNGLTFGSLSAKIMCELITNGESKYEKLFSPSRIKPVAGFADFVKENADVVSKFIGMRFSYERVSALAELAPGEATVAKWEGKKVALYKDEAGKVHALDPVCPHAGCIIAWNGLEKTWDCPCHGARYAYNGALLTGPATHGLTQIKWEDIEGD